MPNGYIVSVLPGTFSEIKIWNPNDWSLIKQIDNRNEFNVMGLRKCDIEYFDNDTLIILIMTRDHNYPTIVSISNGTTKILDNMYDVSSLLVLKSGLLITGTKIWNSFPAIKIWDLSKNDSLIANMTGHVAPYVPYIIIFEMAIVNDEVFVSSANDQSLIFWNLTTYEMIFSLTGHDSDVLVLKMISPNLLAGGCSDNTIKIWDLTSRELVKSLEAHTSRVIDLAVLSSDVLISFSEYSQNLFYWKISTGELIENLNLNSSNGTISALTSLEYKLCF